MSKFSFDEGSGKLSDMKSHNNKMNVSNKEDLKGSSKNVPISVTQGNRKSPSGENPWSNTPDTKNTKI